MGKRYKQNIKQINTKISIWKISIIILIAIIIISLAVIYGYFNIPTRQVSGTNLILNNNNVSKNLKKEILIQNDIIYLSVPDIQNFLDKYIYKEESKNIYVSTYEDNIAEIGINSKRLDLNNNITTMESGVISNDGTEYIPISELEELYNFKITYNKEKDNVIVTSNNRELYSYTVESNSKIYNNASKLKRVVGKVKKGEIVYSSDKEVGNYIEIRKEDGTVGYIKKEKLGDRKVVQEKKELEKQIDGKVNLLWDYFSEYGTATVPKQELDGINVLSPAFFRLNANETIDTNIGQNGKQYIEYAKQNDIKIWPMFQNDITDGKEITSNIMNSYDKRKKLIYEILELLEEYDLDGINIDFENMKQEDKDLFSRFIIELTPVLEKHGKVVSVDVTAPDGGETWSLCFDRHTIGDIANYIVFMAYDQYGALSKVPGTTAGYNWVNISLNKFLKTEEIKPEKIILAIPFYTRVWKTEENGDVKSEIISLKEIDKYLNKFDYTYDESLKQKYMEFEINGNKYQIWAEDEDSIMEKLKLITENNLGGVGLWQRAFASEDIYSKIKEGLNEN